MKKNLRGKMMNVKLTKSLAVAMLSMAAVSSVFAAGDKSKKSQGSSTNCCIENVYGTTGCEMASGRPQVDRCGCNDWYLTVGAIYWHARVGGTEFAYTNNTRTNQIPVKGDVKGMDYDWDWGFRVGLGHVFEHDNWDLNLEFTYFKSSGSRSTNAGCNDIVVANQGSFGIASATNPFGAVETAKSQSRVSYYNFDLELGRAQFNTKYLYFRPHFGFKGCWTDLTQNSRYSDIIRGSDKVDTIDCNYVRVKDTQDWWGFGPRAGFDSKWFIGEKFNLFGDVSFAALFGHHDVDHKEKFSGNPDKKLRLGADKHGFTPYAGIALGVGYDTYVNDNKSHIAVRAGYEVNYFWRMNQLLRIEDSVQTAQKYSRQSEDVAFHGLTVDLKWEF